MENINQSKDDLEIDNLPNRLTMFRIILIPIVLLCLYLSSVEFGLSNNVQTLLGWTAAIIFSIAAITDFFDGYIARKRNIVTVFGSFLDPIADKFLTVSCLIMLQSLGRINAFVVIILVLREMYMTSLRLLALNEGVQVPVNQIGKWKTAIQMIGIPCLMGNTVWNGIPFPFIGSSLILMACVLSIWSATHYTFGMITKLKILRQKNKSQRVKHNE